VDAIIAGAVAMGWWPPGARHLIKRTKMTATMVAAGLLLLVLASPAHAACAWVLWHHLYIPGLGLNPPVETMTPVQAYEAQRDCERHAERMNAKGKQDKDWICFPDTIDPRDRAKR
jgi:hypothetical protein